MTREADMARRFVAVIILTITMAAIASAQIDPFTAGYVNNGGWQSGHGLPGVDGVPLAVVFDGKNVFVGGGFRTAGNTSTIALAAYSLSENRWQALGAGVNSTVDALALSPDGTLFVGGAFSMAGGFPAAHVAAFDPQTDTWSSLGAGVNGRVLALEVGSDGTLYVAGTFSQAGTMPAGGIAAWDGESWTSLGDVAGIVNALYIAEGMLYVGGEFTAIGDLTTSNAAVIDISTGVWQPLGGGVPDHQGVVYSTVNTITSSGGHVYFGGYFAGAFQHDGTYLNSTNVIKWDRGGQEWAYAGFDAGWWIHWLATDTNDIVYAASEMQLEGLLRRIGDEWEIISFPELPYSTFRFPFRIAQIGDQLAIAFSTYLIPGLPGPVQFLYLYTPSTGQWDVLADAQGGGVDQAILALASDQPGGLYAGGDFSFAGPAASPRVAYLSPEGLWQSMGRGASDVVSRLLVEADDLVYVGGRFNEVFQISGESIESRAVAAWDAETAEWRSVGRGVAWSGTAIPHVLALAAEAEGSILVGGFFDSAVQSDGAPVNVDRIARWRPQQEEWQALPSGHGLLVVYALAVDGAGSIYAAGSADNSGVQMARLARLVSGASEWEVPRDWPVQQGSILFDIAVWGNPIGQWGGVYAAVFNDGIWHWSGDEWTSVGGPSFVRALALNGIPEEGGVLYAGANDDPGPWQWDGNEWTVVDEGVAWHSGQAYAPHVVALDIKAHHDGAASLWVGGFFGLAGSHPSASLARWVTQDFGISIDEPPGASQALELAVFPNPMGGSGTVEFILPTPADVRVEVFDLLGRRVLTLLDEERPAGAHHLDLSASGLASGTYIVRLTTGREARAILVTRIE